MTLANRESAALEKDRKKKARNGEEQIDRKAPRPEATSDVTTVEARANFSDLVNRAAYGKERIVLTRRGKAVAAIIPIDDLTAVVDGEGRNELNVDDQ